jgi:hypothetical protein
MTVYPTDHAGLEILPFETYLRLLDSVPVGRVGFFTDGEVVILPVNHLVDGQHVIFRTAPGRSCPPSAARTSSVSKRIATTLAPILGGAWFSAATPRRSSRTPRSAD